MLVQIPWLFRATYNYEQLPSIGSMLQLERRGNGCPVQDTNKAIAPPVTTILRSLVSVIRLDPQI